jgi:hypothetical protein
VRRTLPLGNSQKKKKVNIMPSRRPFYLVLVKEDRQMGSQVNLTKKKRKKKKKERK